MHFVKMIISAGFLILSLFICAQEASTIHLINGSFEGSPRCCTTPDGWIDCGFKTESPPDIQPAPATSKPLFGVTKEAFHGKTYLALVARENDTYESVTQQLSSPMIKDSCYAFSIYLMKSPIYLSGINGEGFGTLRPFTTPIVLRIYGSDGNCQSKELLAESSPVKDTEWKKYDFELQPHSNLTHLQLGVYYDSDSKYPYNGNMLLDQASDMSLIPCSSLKKKK